MVLIKDMQMPFSCDRCRLKDARYHECKVAWRRISAYSEDYTMRKPKWCPLVEVETYGPEGTLYKEK